MGSSDYFKNRKKALDWLRSKGHQISQGKFYNDCDAGFPAVRMDKTVSKWQVAEYAASLGAETASSKPQSTIESEQRKAKADAEMAEMKAEKMRREQDRLWLHADEAWSALAAVVGKLRDAVRRELYNKQVEIVLAAGGETHRAPEVYEHVDGIVDKAFNDVARSGINVEWADE